MTPFPLARTRVLMAEERALLERAAGLADAALQRRSADPFAEIADLLAPLDAVTDVLAARHAALAGRGQRQPDLEALESRLDRMVGGVAFTQDETDRLRAVIQALDHETRPMLNPNNGASILDGPSRDRLRAALDAVHTQIDARPADAQIATTAPPATADGEPELDGF